MNCPNCNHPINPAQMLANLPSPLRTTEERSKRGKLGGRPVGSRDSKPRQRKGKVKTV